MLDRYYSHSTEYVPYAKTVVEHKAPTDDSVRLYGEFVDKARQSLLDVFKLSSSNLDIMVELAYNMRSVGKMAYYKCVINNQDIYGEVDIPFELNSRDDVARIVISNISDKIATALMSKLLISNQRYM